jgi:tetratricopeptide (TPR) repeat protein
MVTRLDQSALSPLAAPLTRGIIAYFQTYWQTHQHPPAHQTGHQAFATVLKEGQARLQQAPHDPGIKLLLGLAVVFDALLQQRHAAWPDLQVFTQGRTWLQQALITQETMADAHLGLGMLYFVGANLPPLLQHFAGAMGGLSLEETIYHLHRAVETGTFSQDIARTFLLQLYVMEKRYDDAFPLGHALQQAYPDNGYYALLTGRSQCAQGHYAACATTLGVLAAALVETPSRLATPDNRFDLYYTRGQALHKTEHYSLAFEAFRQAINHDPQAHRDESLWAKYYLAMLYERRSATKTAQQIYQTLLRGRNVDTLHRQVKQRLNHLR